jgi:hypothetical protein
MKNKFSLDDKVIGIIGNTACYYILCSRMTDERTKFAEFDKK